MPVVYGRPEETGLEKDEVVSERSSSEHDSKVHVDQGMQQAPNDMTVHLGSRGTPTKTQRFNLPDHVVQVVNPPFDESVRE